MVSGNYKSKTQVQKYFTIVRYTIQQTVPVSHAECATLILEKLILIKLNHHKLMHCSIFCLVLKENV